MLANHRIEDEDVTVTSHFLAKCRMSEVVPGCISPRAKRWSQSVHMNGFIP